LEDPHGIRTMLTMELLEVDDGGEISVCLDDFGPEAPYRP
jgi:hypothetical protein